MRRTAKSGDASNRSIHGSVSSDPAGETPWVAISRARVLAMTLCRAP